MDEIQIKVPRDTIQRAARNVGIFDCEHRAAVLVKREDGSWTHNLCCYAGHSWCDCTSKCGERKVNKI